MFAAVNLAFAGADEDAEAPVPVDTSFMLTRT
jgi:hypothetical protein